MIAEHETTAPFEPSAGPPPQVVLIQMVQSLMRAKALHEAARLCIADHLAAGLREIDALAEKTATHPAALYRMMRALASSGVFSEPEPRCFVNTPLSEALRSDQPGSVRDYVEYALHDGNLRAWIELDRVLVDAEPSFERANGCSFFEYLARQPDVAERFDRAMVAFGKQLVEALPRAYDFSQHSSLVDVGGGLGQLLSGLLRAAPRLEGVLFDLPAVTDRARPLLAETELGGRLTIESGDFFERVPGGHGAYLLKHVLHDWDDERAGVILRRVREAIADGGALLVVDSVIEPGDAPDPAKWMDLHMMVALGGRERTEAELAALLGGAGFALERIVQLPGPPALIVAKSRSGG